MFPRSALFLACLLLALAHPHARAQWRPAPEQRVRVLVTEGDYHYRTSATVVEVAGDSLLLLVRGNQRYYPRASLSEVEVSAGRGSRGKWAVTGAVAGAALGFGFALYERNFVGELRKELVSCDKDASCRYRYVRAPYSVAKTLAFTLSGSAVGTVAGWFLPRDRWRPVEAPGRAALPLPPPEPQQGAAR